MNSATVFTRPLHGCPVHGRKIRYHRVVRDDRPRIRSRAAQELGGGPITIVTRGALWAAIGADLPPRTSLRAIVQSQDVASAQKLRELAARFFNAVGEEGPHNQKARDVLPGFDKLVKQLTPKVEEDRLIVK